MKTIEFNFDNVNGLSSVYAIPVSDIHSIVTNPLTGYSRLSLKSNANVVNLQVFAPEQTAFVESQQWANGAPVYDSSIEVFIPRQGDPAIIRTLELGEWVVLHVDANGDILLSGSEDIPMRFFSNKNIRSSNPNGIVGRFSCASTKPSMPIDNRAFYI